jgi:hypothetical protein
MLHVDINYNWEGVAEDNFAIEEKLGEGFACFLFLTPELLFSVRTAHAPPHTTHVAHTVGSFYYTVLFTQTTQGLWSGVQEHAEGDGLRFGDQGNQRRRRLRGTEEGNRYPQKGSRFLRSPPPLCSFFRS